MSFKTREQALKDSFSEENRKNIDIGIKLNKTLETDGWKNIIMPNLENAIINIIGGKNPDGNWTLGKVNGRCKKDETISYYIGYKDALIGFINEINGCLMDYEKSKKVLANKDNVVNNKTNSYETKKRGR